MLVIKGYDVLVIYSYDKVGDELYEVLVICPYDKAGEGGYEVRVICSMIKPAMKHMKF